MYSLDNFNNGVYEVIDVRTGKIIDYYNEKTHTTQSGIDPDKYLNWTINIL